MRIDITSYSNSEIERIKVYVNSEEIVINIDEDLSCVTLAISRGIIDKILEEISVNS